jgi:hypothetical protein
MIVFISYLQEIIIIIKSCDDFRDFNAIFQGRLVDAGNLYETRYEYGSKEMRNTVVLAVRPADRYKVNPHLGVVLAGL